jgi:hypothetical protein
MPTQQTEKAEFTDRIEDRVKDVLKEFQGMELEQMRKGEIKARAQLSDAKKVVDEKRARLERSLKDAQNASGAAWEEARAGAEAAWSELSEAIAHARDTFEGKITEDADEPDR